MMSKFAFLLAEGIKNLWRHKLTATASILTIVICLLFVGSFVLIGQNSHQLIEYFRGKYKIEVFFDEQQSNKKAQELSNQIKEFPNVRSVTFISKEDAIKIFKQQYGEDIYTVLGYNPFPASCVVNIVKDTDGDLAIRELIDRISALPGVSEVHHQGRLINRIERLYFLAVQWGLYFAIILILLSVVIVSNTIKLTVYAKKELIQIMRTIGASNAFIRAPFVMEAVFQSIIASGIATGILYALVRSGNAYLPKLLTGSLHIDVLVITVMTGLAFAITFLGSYRAISKFL